MAEVDGLGALQVRVAGHRPVEVRLGDVDERGHQVAARSTAAQRVRAREHRHVGRHLVVARAGGVQPPADRPDDLGQPALDRHVDVLVVAANGNAPVAQLGLDRVEAAEQRVASASDDDPCAASIARGRATARRRSGPSRQSKPIEAFSAGRRDPGARGSATRRRAQPHAALRPSAIWADLRRRSAKPQQVQRGAPTRIRRPFRQLVRSGCRGRARSSTHRRGRRSSRPERHQHPRRPAGDAGSCASSAELAARCRRTHVACHEHRRGIADRRLLPNADPAPTPPAARPAWRARSTPRLPQRLAMSRGLCDPSADSPRAPAPLGHPRHLALGHLGEERQRERARGHVLADRELALAVAEALAVEAIRWIAGMYGFDCTPRARSARMTSSRSTPARQLDDEDEPAAARRRRRPGTAARGPRCRRAPRGTAGDPRALGEHAVEALELRRARARRRCR